MGDDNVIRFPSAPGEPPKLRVADVVLGELAEAMRDNSGHMTWTFDRATGEVLLDPEGHDEVDDEDDERDVIEIDSEGPHEPYRDMERYASCVGDEALSRRLQRSLEGRGAFRRFKDELHSMPDFYVQKWQEYSNLRDEGRAVDWLLYHDVVDQDDAERESAERERRAVAVLDEIEAQGGMRIDVAEVAGRWSEIVAAIEAGTPVTVTRDGDLFAVIAPGD